jgi:ribonuclease E
MSRQRLRPALSEGSHITCPRCQGTGHIRDTESSALQILRMVQEESMKDNTAAVHVQVPVEVVSFLLNEKRQEISRIELKQRLNVLLIPNPHLQTPNYKLERLRHDDPRLESFRASYTMIEEPADEVAITRREKAKAKQEPIIKGVVRDEPAPVAEVATESAAAAGTSRADAKPAGRAPVASAPVAKQPAGSTATAPSTASSGGFFGWIKRIFGGAPAAAPAPAASPAVAAPAGETATGGSSRDRKEGRDGRRGGRGGESRRGGRDGRSEGRGEGRSEGRGDGGDASKAKTEGREARETREPREHREGREGRADQRRQDNRRDAGRDIAPETVREGEETRSSERRERRDRRGERRSETRVETTDEASLQSTPIQEASTPTGGSDVTNLSPISQGPDVAGGEHAEGGDGGEGRRRRRRGGRGRGRDGAEGSTELATEQVSDQGHEGSHGVTSATPEQSLASEPSATAPAWSQEDSTGAEAASAAETQSTPVDAVATPVATVRTESPLAAAPAPAIAAPFVLPVDTLQALAADAGLQWVHSDAGKVQAAQQAIADTPKPAHEPRMPKPRVAMDEGPLVLVETRKDLSQVRMPFDQA